METPKLFVEITIHSGNGAFLSTRKIQLLQAIEQHGSILKASERIDMSYKHAWDCVQEMNKVMHYKLVDSNKNHGSKLTKQGKYIVEMYFGIQKACSYGLSYMREGKHSD